MSLSMKKTILICIGLALFFTNALIPSSLSYAQKGVKPEVVLPEHYPDGFDGFGRIDRIARDEVVIDDDLIPLASYVSYHTPKEMNAPSYLFVQGKLVGFIKNSENAIESLWLIE
jgi:hypothetical protein